MFITPVMSKIKQIRTCQGLPEARELSAEPFMIKNAASFLGWPDTYKELAHLSMYEGSKDMVSIGGYGESEFMSATDALRMVSSSESTGAYIAGWEYAVGDLATAIESRIGTGIPLWEDHCLIRRLARGLSGAPAAALTMISELMKWLFIGKPGTSSLPHVDPLGSNGWMYVFSGRKRWRIAISKSGAPGQYCVCNGDPSPQPCMHCFEPSNEALREFDFYEGIVEAGDLIFVPGGAFHAVENLPGPTPVIAVTHNFSLDKALLKAEVDRAMSLGNLADLSDNLEVDSLLSGLVLTLTRYPEALHAFLNLVA